uniref:Uncharacterized protein n=1 Tax=Felis catus TaxID=9685 RepID=A0ABI7WZI7_FELCA
AGARAPVWRTLREQASREDPVGRVVRPGFFGQCVRPLWARGRPSHWLARFPEQIRGSRRAPGQGPPPPPLPGDSARQPASQRFAGPAVRGGLQEVADQLDLQRIGRQHQAGSDSLLTGMAFFRMKELFFEDSIDDAKYCGRLYGLGTGVAQKQNEDVDSAQEKMSILAIINNMQQ